MAMPAMYEENLYEERKNLPRVVGTVRNSPAAYAGLEKGDVILEINGLSVRNRPQARDILALLQSGENEQVRLAIRRDDHTLQLAMDPRRGVLRSHDRPVYPHPERLQVVQEA